MIQSKNNSKPILFINKINAIKNPSILNFKLKVTFKIRPLKFNF